MRALIVSVLVLVGCTSEISSPVALATHALDCAQDEICPDGSVCPDDGVCPEPGDGWAGDCDALAQACANLGGDGPDPQACQDWLNACFPNGVGGDGGGGGGAGACEDLALACLNDGAIPDRAACDEWLDDCAPDAVQDVVGDDLLEAAQRACDLLDMACQQGMEDGCWLSDELCTIDGQLDVDGLREHACGLLDEVCARGFEAACEVAPELGCGDAGGGGGGGGGDACGDALAACQDGWDRDVCFAWFETCAPAELRGEGPECADSLHACGGGDLASCQAWLAACPPDSVREPACVDTLTACYTGDAAACADILGACL